MRTIILLAASLAAAAQTASDSPRFTPEGKLELPKDYREWIYLSAGLGMTYGPLAQERPSDPMFENVFVTPRAYKAFVESGQWPDKTMFILEIRRSVSQGSINNAGHYQSEIAAVEASVKDEQRFPQKWAYFGFGHGDTATPIPATSTCNACHGKNAAVDNTFVQFYPTLLPVATRKGTLKPSYVKESAGH